MLPPIDSARGRGALGSASRHNPAEGLRNNGAAIMGHQHSSAKNLNSHHSGNVSNNGSDGGVRDSMNIGRNKYAQEMRPYVKGACYDVNLQPNNQVLGSPRMSYEQRPTQIGGSRMSPRGQAAAA